MMLAAYYTQIGLLTVGDIIMIQSLMLQFLMPLFMLGSMYRSFNDNLIDIHKISDIMDTPASVQPGVKAVAGVRGEVEFKDVGFRYLN
jgi:ABC-type transport system involved in Fe-S cluster assembly fused permease/ATPase subunit